MRNLFSTFFVLSKSDFFALIPSAKVFKLYENTLILMFKVPKVCRKMLKQYMHFCSSVHLHDGNNSRVTKSIKIPYFLRSLIFSLRCYSLR